MVLQKINQLETWGKLGWSGLSGGGEEMLVHELMLVHERCWAVRTSTGGLALTGS